MGGKKKPITTKTWTLAGEPVYSSVLNPAEEYLFKETVSHFREIAVQMREESDRYSGVMGVIRTGQQAARASADFFCKYFEGKYQRLDVVKALATAATLPSPSADQFSTSPIFLLGAALWLLDYMKRQGLEEEFYTLLPAELGEEIIFEMPCVDDFHHSRDEILGVLSVFRDRKGSSRQAFRKLWRLVDKDTSVNLKEVFKDAVLDYLDRFLEVSIPSVPLPRTVRESAPRCWRIRRSRGIPLNWTALMCRT